MDTRLSVITTSLEDTSHGRGYDALLRIGRNNARTEYAAIIKKYVTNDTLGALTAQLRHTKPRGILVTHHVTPNQSERLKTLNVPFFDTAGNAFLADETLDVFVSGRRPEHEKPKEKPNRAFQPSGLRTVFALLCNPGLELQGHRAIAAAASVSHGTIGLVIERSTERRLSNRHRGEGTSTNQEGRFGKALDRKISSTASS